MNRYKRKLLRLKSTHRYKTPEIKKMKSEIQKEQRQAYWTYIENMIFNIPVQDDSTTHTKIPKNLFSYIKTQKTDNQSIPPLRDQGILKTDNKSKADILNKQFQKAFSDNTNTAIPDTGHSTHTCMQEITITQNGILKLLQDVKPHKAAGPDNINGKIL